MSRAGVSRDIAKRFPFGVPYISSDAYTAYRSAVAAAFGTDCNYGQVIKKFRKDEFDRMEVIEVRKKVVFGNPDLDDISTSFIERSNLTWRMSNRRLTRCTNGYSKLFMRHADMLAITFMVYNFSRAHMSLKGKTPAQAAEVSAEKWELAEIVQMIDSHHQRKLEAEFERAFEVKYQQPRLTPKSYTPTPKADIKLPWYLDPEGDAPELP